MPNTRTPLPAPDQGELIARFLKVEEKKLHVEEKREDNAAKELEYSRKSSEEANELAKLDLENQKDYITKSFVSRDRAITYIFIIIVFVVICGVGLILFFGKNSPDILDKLFNFIKDSLKVVAGVVIGWFANGAKSKKKKASQE